MIGHGKLDWQCRFLKTFALATAATPGTHFAVTPAALCQKSRGAHGLNTLERPALGHGDMVAKGQDLGRPGGSCGTDSYSIQDTSAAKNTK